MMVTKITVIQHDTRNEFEDETLGIASLLNFTLARQKAMSELANTRKCIDEVQAEIDEVELAVDNLEKMENAG